VLCGATAFSTLDLALLPTMSAFYAQRKVTLLRQYLSLMGRLAMLYVGATAIALWVAGPWFLDLWAGHKIFPGTLTFGLLILLFAIQVLIDPPWILLVASTQHYGAASMHTVESLLNLGLSIWWVRRFGLPGVIAGTVVARLLTTAWYIPIVAARIVETGLGRVTRAIVLPAFVSAAATGAIFLWFAHVAIGGAAVPLIAAAAALTFSVIFTMLAFSRQEREAAIDYIGRFVWRTEAAP
jgi:O-antigen/teichoic acid export membrane protein